ncbi:MAG: magnesium/cobalt transporter CorA [Thermomicrobiales bacterium]|nr:magnesium/cobalt transporter CorA [Thermomicrobiales bacterium]
MTIRRFDLDAPGLFSDAKDSASTLAGADWLDITDPTSSELHVLAERYRLHPLALEDIEVRLQRPKAEEYPGHLFVVLYALDAQSDGRPQMRELSIVVTSETVITLHHTKLPQIDAAAHRWAEHCQGNAHVSPAMLLYTIADTVVDGYFPCMDVIGDQIEDLEARVFDHGSTGTVEEVFRLKRLLLDVRRVVAPTRDVFNAFTRRELPLLGEVSIAYFQDVYDHVIRVTETIDNYREILSTIIDVHLTVVSNDLNQTVRTLTVASIILMTLALIAGIYGMNFDTMPELHWHYGYYAVLIGMVVLTVVLAWAFRKLRWW